MVKMKQNGKSLRDITEFAGLTKNNLYKYVLSKEEFLKSKAYMEYIYDNNLKRKAKNGSLTQRYIEKHQSIREANHKTYSEYRAWLKTDEAKKRWGNLMIGNELRLFVDNILNKTDSEEKRYNELLTQLETNNSVEKIIVTDGKNLLIIDDYNSNSNNKIEKIEAMEIPFSIIDEVPTLPECEDLPNNEARKKCMSQFVAKHVNKNFNIKIGDSLNLKGRQRIFVSFKIDTDGNIKDTGARAAHPALETEAIRVINTLPQFIPGKHKGKVVTVPYSLPIVFEIKSENAADKEQLSNINGEKEKLYLNLLKKRERNRAEKINTIPFSKVSKVPTYGDCELKTNNAQIKTCTSTKILKFVNQNYNVDLLNTLGISGTQRIFVSFIIDKAGSVKSIEARAAHPKLEEEAIRVIKSLPQFKPGLNGGKKVNVAYSLPILLEIRSPKKD